MTTLDLTIERAKDEIVFALKKQAFEARPIKPVAPAKEPAKKALHVENRDLESAIDDMMDRFPKTLEYLAK